MSEESVTPMGAVSLYYNIELKELPQCPKCKQSVLLPFPDETREAKNVVLKAWVCPNCYQGLTTRSGAIEQVVVMKPIPR